MAPRKQSTRRKRQAKTPVIELTAEEVKAAESGKDDAVNETRADDSANAVPESKEAGEGNQDALLENDREETPASPEPVPKGNLSRLVLPLALIIVAAAGGAWLYQQYGAALSSNDQLAQVDARSSANTVLLQENQQKLADINEKLTGTSEAAADLAAQFKTLSATITEQSGTTASQQAVTGLQDNLAKLEEKIAAIETVLAEQQNNLDNVRQALTAAAADSANAANAEDRLKFEELQSAFAALASRLSAMEQNPPGTAASKVVENLTARLDGLDETVAALSAAPSDPTKELATALAALKQQVASGEDYRQAAQHFSSLMPQAPGLSTIAAHADDGVATISALSEQLTKLLHQFKPAPAPEENTEPGIFDGVSRKLSGLVTIRKKGEVDWPRSLEQALTHLENNDTAAALESVTSHTVAPPADIAAWVDAANRHQTVNQALALLSNAVLERLEASGQE